jgi:hypothetical protein
MGISRSYAALGTGEQIGLLSDPKPLQTNSKTFCNNPKKGPGMTPTEHPPKTPSPRTGLLTLVPVLVVLAFAFAAVPAFAEGGEGTCPNEQLRAEQPYGLSLPDCRAYEMVSPLQTNGGDATDSPPRLIPGRVRASEDPVREASGEETEPAITYGARTAYSEAAGSLLEDQVLSHREPANDRWSTQSITPPSEEASLLGGYEGVYFTPELSQGLTDTHASLPPGAAPAGLEELYLANFFSGSYQLVSHFPPSEEIYHLQHYPEEDAVNPEGASSDLSHVAFEGGYAPVSESHLYEFAAGQVVQVGVSNTGEDWTVSAGYHSGVYERTLQDTWHAMSAGGSRVVFTYAGELYLRVNGEREQSEMNGEECLEPTAACTLKLSPGGARYWGANTEDTKVFYTENGDLYEYSLPAAHVTGRATALTHGGEVQGVAQISEDGAYVYFIANADLTGAAQAGHPNLYVSHNGGEPAFIATLSGSDSADWNKGPEENQAVVSPGGVYLAFTSEEDLTGYDNQPAEEGECEGKLGVHPRENGKKCLEVYLYDAESSALVCASCNPSGVRPVGGAGLSEGGANERSGDYRPRALLKAGVLFFDSSDALVAHSSGGRYNVYEYQDGHVYPVSNVGGSYESFFLDASPNGENVFFASADQLLPEDTGDNVEVWDARVDGGFPVAAPPCTTAEACRNASPPTPFVFGPPPSATFSGPGNLAPQPAVVVKPKPKTVKCKKGFVKNSKDKCVKKKSKKSKAKKSAHTNRRAGR